ncbi:MAG TPA: substrate-binding domain-containing protein [Thermoanaerobaculia bacterium]|jgi:ABC-type phosphate transport system substrate-binding protein|nr:substrate-binding domain-containing protein [Thermoanaerobaculia bacterium]
MEAKNSKRTTHVPSSGSVRRRSVYLAVVMLLLGLTGSMAADSFVVIVNEASPLSALSKQQVSDVFFRKTTKWQDGTDAVPIDLGESSPTRASFSKSVLGKGVAAVKSYWQRMIFSGRAVPPSEKASAADVMSFVRTHPGAIGYVPQGTPLAPGVKALALEP